MPFTTPALLFSLVTLLAEMPQQAPATTPKPAAGAPTTGAPAIARTCEYVDPKDAAALLGPEVSASTAPSLGGLLSCGYTSPGGDALTVSIADYGVASVAQEFFTRTREALKTTTNEDALGVPGFAFVATDAPAHVNVTAVKDTQIVTIESSGPAAGTAPAVATLRALMIKLLPKVTPPPAPAAAPDPKP
jgi:hypothetical protein